MGTVYHDVIFQYLISLGFSVEDLIRLRDQGWTVGMINREIQDLLKNPICNETGVYQDFKIKHPELFIVNTDAVGFDLRSKVQTLDQVELKTARWLVPKYIPVGQITSLGGDGGDGKTSVWVNLASAISSGKTCFLDDTDPERSPQKVLVLSAEDSVSVVLKRQLLDSGASESNIIVPKPETMRDFKFGSRLLEEIIAEFRPALCVFDPIQGFLPSGHSISDRGQMRDCTAPLVSLGERFDTSFLLIVHTNKRLNVSGRNRLADSADIWDVSRSVIMIGKADDSGKRYLSQEKNSYGELSETVLFRIVDGRLIQRCGTTMMRDEDFQRNKTAQKATKTRDTQRWLTGFLKDQGGKASASDVGIAAKAAGIAERTLERARAPLTKSGEIVITNTGYGPEKKHYYELNTPDIPHSQKMAE